METKNLRTLDQNHHLHHATNSFLVLVKHVFSLIHRSVCSLGALFVWLFVPETSGKTLSQLASIYKKDKIVI